MVVENKMMLCSLFCSSDFSVGWDTYINTVLSSHILLHEVPLYLYNAILKRVPLLTKKRLLQQKHKPKRCFPLN